MLEARPIKMAIWQAGTSQGLEHFDSWLNTEGGGIQGHPDASNGAKLTTNNME